MPIYSPLPSSWPRMAQFRRFLENPCTCAMTASVDITPLVRAAGEHALSVNGLLLWCVSYIVNNREEFRLTVTEDGVPAVWEECHPVHNVFHEDTETYTTLYTRWDASLPVFLTRLAEDTSRALSLTVPVIPSPPNTFEVSALPWLRYDSVSVSMQYPPLSPMIVWGQFTEHNDRVTLPVTLQIHHAAADGFHITRFFRELQNTAAGVGRRL